MKLKKIARVAVGAMALLLLMGYLTGGILFYGVSALILLLFAVDLARLWRMQADAGRIYVDRNLSRRELPAGSTSQLIVELTYTGVRPLPVRVSQPLPRSIASTFGEPSLILKPNTILTLTADLKPSKYGDFQIPSMRIAFESWLFESEARPDSPLYIFVKVAIGQSLIRPGAVFRSAARHSEIFENVTRKSGGSDFSKVRRYEAGDNAKNIDWALSGKTGSLIVREYEDERIMPVYFLIDVDASMGIGKKTGLDSAVGLAAALIDQLIIDNERVGLACFSRDEVVRYEQIGLGREHVAKIKDILSSAKPMASFSSRPVGMLRSTSAHELYHAGLELDSSGALGTVLEETLKSYMANVREDGFSAAVLKVSKSTPSVSHLVIMTNLSMGMTSLLNGIRMAGYYGHSVSVVLTPRIWHEEKDIVDGAQYYEEYVEVKAALAKLRRSSVKVTDLSSLERPEDLIYASRIKSRLTGIRG